MELSAIFAGLCRHHVATPANPLPPATPGITWLWAANGIFKRGVSAELDILIPVADVVEAAPRDTLFAAPGLVNLLPHVRWARWPRPIAGSLLGPLLTDARLATDEGTIARPIEKQYFIAHCEQRGLKLIAPRAQRGTAGRVTYAVPEGERLLVDIHSHHSMPPFFSGTDDGDDTGLSVSVVIGHLYTRPALCCRLNVHGHRMDVPAGMVFEHLGPFADAYALPALEEPAYA
jgi:hypothetical protein